MTATSPLRSKRTSLGLTQTQAGALFNPPVHSTEWSKMEHGKVRIPARVQAWLDGPAQPVRPKAEGDVPLWRWLAHLSAEREPHSVQKLPGISGVEVVWRETRHLMFRVVLSHPVFQLDLEVAPRQAVVSTLHNGRTQVSTLASFNSVLDTLDEQRKQARTQRLDVDHIGAERVFAAVMAWCAATQSRRLLA